MKSIRKKIYIQPPMPIPKEQEEMIAAMEKQYLDKLIYQQDDRAYYDY